MPLFSKNAENGEKLAALVKKIEAECSFAELGFFGVQIREHIIKHFAEKRRQLKKGYNHEKVGIQVTVKEFILKHVRKFANKLNSKACMLCFRHTLRCCAFTLQEPKLKEEQKDGNTPMDVSNVNQVCSVRIRYSKVTFAYHLSLNGTCK